MKVLRIAVLLATVATIGSAATLQNCGTCQGGVYTLDFSNFSSGVTNDTLTLTLTIDTTGYTGGGTYINAVAPKPSDSIVSVVPVSAPTSNPGGSTWSTVLNQGINSGGCSNGGGGFFCTSSSGLGAPVSNGTNTWVWNVTVAHGTLYTDLVGASLKVLYVDGSGNKVGALVSETFGDPSVPPASIPEPSTFVLVGSSLLAVSVLTQKVRARKS